MSALTPDAADSAATTLGGAGRSVLLVAGAGRSGTSTLAGLMRILGLRQPAPEVPADPSNPKGFGEPQWVVDLHDQLLAQAGVQVSDSRPAAWLDTTAVCLREPLRMRCATWLDRQLPPDDAVRELVVKDPRLAWFLPLWRVAALRAGIRPALATVLRPPAEVVLSKQTHYANRLGDAHLTASWLNMHLHLERATRGTEDSGMSRVLLRYEDLLDDWVRTTTRTARVLGLRHVLDADVERVREGHRFVDPTLRRTTASLADLDLPPRLREITEETWRALSGLAEPDAGGHREAAEQHHTLDALREAYLSLYADSEAITRSTVVAARLQARARAETRSRAEGRAHAETRPRRVRPDQGGPGRAATADPPPARAADRVPHRVRALVPSRVRRSLRRALGRPR